MKDKMSKDLVSTFNSMKKMPFGVVITDTNFKIIYINDKIKSMYGYSEEELLGKDPIVLNAEPGSKEIQRNIEQTISMGNDWSNYILNCKKDLVPFYQKSGFFEDATTMRINL